jgi:hypothetical protein
MEDNNAVFLGTEIKIKISIDPTITAALENGKIVEKTITMSEYNFTIDFYCNSKKVIVASKKDTTLVNLMKLEDDNNSYIAFIDTGNLDAGLLKCKITAFIPDEHFEDKIRTEVQIKDTGINIIKTL